MTGDGISVVIPLCGDLKYWRPLAERAFASVEAQTVPPVSVHVVEADTVAAARNRGAEAAHARHLVFLDADDELDSGYVEAMSSAVVEGPALYQPSTLGIVNGRQEDMPTLIRPKKSLLDGNWMVIGTMVEREQLLRVGGFDDSLPAVEDWDLWLRCWRDGARFVQVGDATYRVHIRPNSRNEVSRADAVRLFKEVRARYEVPA